MSKQRPQISLTTGKRLGPRNVANASGQLVLNSQSFPEDVPATIPQPVVDPSTLRTGSPFAEGTARPKNFAEIHAVAGDGVAGDGVARDGVARDGIVSAGTPILAVNPTQWSSSVASETANGATLATWLIFPLGLLSIVWFPLGTLIVSCLGMTLALIGITSRWQLASTIALFSHLPCAIFAYLQLL